jgi:hypothetical protein
MNRIPIGESYIRIDEDSGFLCITDMAAVKGNASDNIKNWMRLGSSIEFFKAWEYHNNPDFDPAEYDVLRRDSTDNTFTLTSSRLVGMGAVGIFVTRGRYGGTFCHIDWATHFANWLDPHFYVLTLRTARELSDRIYGRDKAYLRFSRELAAKNYGLITEKNSSRDIPKLPKPRTKDKVVGGHKKIVRRHLKQADADVINVAVWEMTAKAWRSTHGVNNSKVNMRDFATAEELQVVSGLQHLMRNWQEDQYTRDEMLQRAILKGKELLKFYCDTDKKMEALKAARKKRGW